MTVQQTDDQNAPPALTIYFAERLSSTASAIVGAKKIADKHAPSPESGEKTAVVDLKDLSYQEIWSRVQASTGAEEVPASAEDEAERKRLEAITAKAGKDRERIRAMRQAKKDQERMLAEARGEVEKLREL
jgi:large subunit ribosomal protein MRP49